MEPETSSLNLGVYRWLSLHYLIEVALISALKELFIIYMRELRLLLRDHHTLIYSCAIPLFLYPVILFVVFQAMSLVKGWQESEVSDVAIVGSVEIDTLEKILFDEPSILQIYLEEDGALGRARSRLSEGDLDAIVELTGGEKEGEPIMVWLTFNSAYDASVSAKSRMEKVIEKFQTRLFELQAIRLGKQEVLDLALQVEEKDISSNIERSNLILSQILPLLLMVILVMGAFYPALDLAAGERERQTLETSLIAPVSRWKLVSGKYLAVVSFAWVAFILNLASMTFSLKHILVQIDVQAFSISFSSLWVILLGGMFLAGMISAILLVIAFTARSFKEGQSMMTPVYAVLILPISVTLSPQLELSAFWACVPVVNAALVFREVLQESYNWPLIVLTLITSIIYTAIAITFASWFISRESFLFGEGQSSWFSFLRRRAES